jgi:hypothetical protein
MSRALVPLTSPVRDHVSFLPVGRANAAFVAHLIATSVKAPQTRRRRRAEPSEAATIYSGVGQWPMPLGRAFSQSL